MKGPEIKHLANVPWS